ncbi:MAG: glycosyltransferase family 39 protein [Deltaproteobacteria bacterium]|nr:glycosyltransferase family 39 protein [Deltaproteobacteria bacterium]
MGAVIVGAALRLYQLPNQILFGDEWHAIHAAANSGYFSILSTFGAADRSIPITLYYKILMDTVGLSETAIRTPFFVGGVLTVTILPIMVRPITGRTVSNIFAWLLALSPTLIFYSRFARPYAITTFFSFLACLFFFRWWETNARKEAIWYVLLTIATGYALLVDLPFVLGPFLFYLVWSVIGKEKNRIQCLLKLAGLGLMTIVPLLILLAPPLYGDFSAISTKAGQSASGFSQLLSSFRILTGMDQRTVVLVIVILASFGIIRMLIGLPVFTLFLMSLSLLQLTAVLWVQPVGIDSPHILSRYLLPLLPFLLLAVSTGIHAISSIFPIRFRKWAGVTIPMAFCVAFFWGGPVPAVSYQPNNGMSLMLLVHALTGARYQRILKDIPGFYKYLSKIPPDSVTVVEAPFPWQGNHLLLYQEVHGQKVIMGVTRESAMSKGLHLKTVVVAEDLKSLKARKVDFLIFHRNLQNEVNIVLPAAASKSWDLRVLRTIFGNSVYEDHDIVVFDVSKSFVAQDFIEVENPKEHL